MVLVQEFAGFRRPHYKQHLRPCWAKRCLPLCCLSKDTPGWIVTSEPQAGTVGMGNRPPALMTHPRSHSDRNLRAG